MNSFRTAVVSLVCWALSSCAVACDINEVLGRVRSLLQLENSFGQQEYVQDRDALLLRFPVGTNLNDLQSEIARMVAGQPNVATTVAKSGDVLLHVWCETETDRFTVAVRFDMEDARLVNIEYTQSHRKRGSPASGEKDN